MKWTPKDYQEAAIGFAVRNPHSGLLLDMGLGKTSIMLAVAKVCKLKRVLLIAPIRTLYTVWPEEVKKWDDFNDITFHNWHESRLPVDQLPVCDIYGINPESALTLFKRAEFWQQGWDALIIDESHTFKNPSSQRFKWLRKYLHLFPRRHILTGTFSPNGLEDIWSQIFILDRGKALTQYITHFRNAYCTPSWDGYSYTVSPGKVNQIYEKIDPLVLRLAAKDHLEMPELILNSVNVKLSSKAMRTYKDMQDEFIILLQNGDAITAPNAAAAGNKCRQIANGGVYHSDGTVEHIHNEKIEALEEIIEGMNGNPLLVFYEFRHDITRLQKLLGADVPNLTGAKDPLGMVKRFNAGEIPVMIGHGATVGVGLNLQESCYNVCWMGVPWDLAMHDQANARVYRQGQKSPRVFIHYIMAEGTMDQTVLKVLAQKGRDQEALYAALKNTSL